MKHPIEPRHTRAQQFLNPYRRYKFAAYLLRFRLFRILAIALVAIIIIIAWPIALIYLAVKFAIRPRRSKPHRYQKHHDIIDL